MEVKRYQLDVGLTSMHSVGCGTKLLNRCWFLSSSGTKLWVHSFSGVAQGERCKVGVCFHELPAGSPANERVTAV